MNTNTATYYRRLIKLIQQTSDDDNIMQMIEALNRVATDPTFCGGCDDLSRTLKKIRADLRKKNDDIKYLKREIAALKKSKSRKRREIAEYHEPVKIEILKDEDGPNDFAHALHNGAFSTILFD